jgi:hypothetical protein
VLRLDGAWDGKRARRWENPKRCQATAVQETRIRNLTRRREGAKGLGINKGVLECSGKTELGMGRERVDGKIQSGVKPPQSKKEGSGISREDAEVRKGGVRVPQLPKTFCGKEGVLECFGLTELGMGRERDDGKSKAVSSHRSPRNQDPESHAETRRCERVGVESRSCPRRFVAMRGVLECSGLTELWMGSSKSMGKSKAVSSHRSPRNQDPA